MALDPKVNLLLTLAEATPIAPLAKKFEAALADGKITLEEGVGLADTAAQLEMSLTPGTAGDPEVKAFLGLAKVVEQYFVDKAAEKAASEPA